jgi:hypothetical protein
MTKMLAAVSAMILAGALASTPEASAQTAAGKWKAEFPTRISNVNGQVTADETGTALMTIELKGDSVFGTWLAESGRDAGTPRTLRGTFLNGKLTVASDPVERTVTRNNGGADQQVTLKISMVLEGDVTGDEIAGAFAMQFEDHRSPPLKWTARREKSN